jgi:hypothetical protein
MTETVLFTSVHIHRHSGDVSYSSQAVMRGGVLGWMVGGTEFRPFGEWLCRDFGVLWAWTPVQEAAYEAHTSAIIADYRAARANMTDEQRAEEAFEMRAAFGPGETVVDVFTGERFYTGD